MPFLTLLQMFLKLRFVVTHYELLSGALLLILHCVLRKLKLTMEKAEHVYENDNLIFLAISYAFGGLSLILQQTRYCR